MELAKAGADVAVNFNQDKTGAAAPVDEIIANVQAFLDKTFNVKAPH